MFDAMVHFLESLEQRKQFRIMSTGKQTIDSFCSLSCFSSPGGCRGERAGTEGPFQILSGQKFNTKLKKRYPLAYFVVIVWFCLIVKIIKIF